MATKPVYSRGSCVHADDAYHPRQQSNMLDTHKVESDYTTPSNIDTYHEREGPQLQPAQTCRPSGALLHGHAVDVAPSQQDFPCWCQHHLHAGTKGRLYGFTRPATQAGIVLRIICYISQSLLKPSDDSVLWCHGSAVEALWRFAKTAIVGFILQTLAL